MVFYGILFQKDGLGSTPKPLNLEKGNVRGTSANFPERWRRAEQSAGQPSRSPNPWRYESGR